MNKIEEILRKEWEELDNNPPHIPEDTVLRIKQSLNMEISKIAKKKHNLKIITSYAAAIFLMVVTVFTYSLYRENRFIASNTVNICTGSGETVSISLPDGSKAQMNYESSITYQPGEFGLKTRSIMMDGEIYFEIAKDAEKPFIIESENMHLEVLGTKFNLNARSKEKTVRIILDEGSVKVSSQISGDNAIITAGEELTIDSNGIFTVIRPEHFVKGGWKKRMLTYRNTQMKDVLEDITNIYGIEIETDENVDLQELFTGTLSINNLNGVIEVMETVFGMKAVLNERKVIITKR